MRIEGRLWVGGQCRKSHNCRTCGNSVVPGNTAFRFLGEDPNIRRGDRMCESCAKKLGKELK